MNDRKLVEAVRNCPCLYDKSHADFKDRQKKRRAWVAVANILEVDETIAMKRWGNLRERFTKEIRSPRNDCVGRHWALLDSLQFLKEHIVPRPMRQSAPECTESTPSVKKRKAELNELDTTIVETVRPFQNVCACKASLEEVRAEISGFATMISSVISKMNKKTRAEVMRRCTEIVMQAQIDEEEDSKFLISYL